MKTPDDPHFLDDPDAPASEDELREAEALRAALEDPSVPDEGAELLRALAHAHAPRALSEHVDETEHRAMIARAIARGPERRGRLVRLSFRAGAALALAAGLLFAVTRLPGVLSDADTAAPLASSVGEAPAPLVASRSTQALFREPFERGGTSARIDRIAMARASDLRDNRFAMWGAP